ncbi:transcriptional repressor NrdR [Prevotella dentalis DSM 3688]|uniref:Transcriptional repressor NrdR n=1 Tax=Prevotella dentalis (strain ATCC 49559 / DSM 3688 / JCM 13448 / NCTC 12043 / ES 2772) TaxID=908937 RepID=F9CZN6_PREDD|nr:transcriptional repressor NrdR [Prevotella dentalis DSM 3688]
MQADEGNTPCLCRRQYNIYNKVKTIRAIDIKKSMISNESYLKNYCLSIF